jgi:hypothetical protein
MKLICWFVLFLGNFKTGFVIGIGYRSILPAGCDTAAALQCEYEFLLCKLFQGPANDRGTLCNCASVFYGRCLRLAGVSFPCISYEHVRHLIIE